MKKLIKKFKDQPLPIKILASIFILWVYPFIYSMMVGAGGWYDLDTLSLVLMGISIIPFAYMTWQFGIKVIIYWIGALFKKKR